MTRDEEERQRRAMTMRFEASLLTMFWVAGAATLIKYICWLFLANSTWVIH